MSSEGIAAGYFKKLFALGGILLLIFSLTSCSNSKSGNEPKAEKLPKEVIDFLSILKTNGYECNKPNVGSGALVGRESEYDPVSLFCGDAYDPWFFVFPSPENMMNYYSDQCYNFEERLLSTSDGRFLISPTVEMHVTTEPLEANRIAKLLGYKSSVQTPTWCEFENVYNSKFK